MILLGLEILVAADIIRSVEVAPTFHSVGILALIVIVLRSRWWSPQSPSISCTLMAVISWCSARRSSPQAWLR